MILTVFNSYTELLIVKDKILIQINNRLNSNMNVNLHLHNQFIILKYSSNLMFTFRSTMC